MRDGEKKGLGVKANKLQRFTKDNKPALLQPMDHSRGNKHGEQLQNNKNKHTTHIDLSEWWIQTTATLAGFYSHSFCWTGPLRGQTVGHGREENGWWSTVAADGRAGCPYVVWAVMTIRMVKGQRKGTKKEAHGYCVHSARTTSRNPENKMCRDCSSQSLAPELGEPELGSQSWANHSWPCPSTRRPFFFVRRKLEERYSVRTSHWTRPHVLSLSTHPHVVLRCATPQVPCGCLVCLVANTLLARILRPYFCTNDDAHRQSRRTQVEVTESQAGQGQGVGSQGRASVKRLPWWVTTGCNG